MTDKPNAMPSGALTADERAAIVRRHFAVMEEQQLFDRLWFAHAFRMWPALRAAIDRIKGVAHVAPAPMPTAPVAEPVNVTSQDLRVQLGLS